MRLCALLLSLLCCACGGNGAEQQTVTERVPDWATAKPGTTYDDETGLPKEVIDKKTGIEFVLIPAGVIVLSQRRTESGVLAFYITDDIHDAGNIRFGSPLVDDRQLRAESLRERSRPFHTAGIRRDHNKIRVFLPTHRLDDDRKRE